MSGMIHKPGDLVGGRYKVKTFIGEGGMQEVYLAKDKLLDRPVALKSPKGASAQKRFKRSAVVSARVNHSNIAKTLDYFEDEDRPYLIEELVEGCNLAEFLRDHVQALDPYSVARVFHHLAKGIQASHHAGVAHRDMKPSNVMVLGGHKFSDVKITDFGIAKLAADEIKDAVEGGGESLTASATALGALPYMAPEMIDDFKSADKPADIWALGAMTFELLTGKKPFGDGYKAVPAIQAAKIPDLPKEVAQSKQFSSLSASIYAIIGKCLVKDIAERITADELVSECGKLCYTDAPRFFGTITSYDHNAFGFISKEDGAGSVFYHVNSTYNAAPIGIGRRVWFSSFPGSPRPRAFPVVGARDKQANSQ